MVFADSVNVARRLSSKAENDLVQENFVNSTHNHKECMALSRKLNNVSQLPKECHVFQDIVSSLDSQSKSDSSIAFQGMGNSASARASHAQIQRRYTNTRRFTKQGSSS